MKPQVGDWVVLNITKVPVTYENKVGQIRLIETFIAEKLGSPTRDELFKSNIVFIESSPVRFKMHMVRVLIKFDKLSNCVIEFKHGSKENIFLFWDKNKTEIEEILAIKENSKKFGL